MKNLEGRNNGLNILDVQLKSRYRIIALYRIFNPPGIVTQCRYFTALLNLIKQAVDRSGGAKIWILGDFNLNEEMKYKSDNSHKAYFVKLQWKSKQFQNQGLLEAKNWKKHSE